MGEDEKLSKGFDDKETQRRIKKSDIDKVKDVNPLDIADDDTLGPKILKKIGINFSFKTLVFRFNYICESKLITLCGIIGIWAKNKSGEAALTRLENALESLKHRGPDNQSYKL